MSNQHIQSIAARKARKEKQMADRGIGCSLVDNHNCFGTDLLSYRSDARATIISVRPQLRFSETFEPRSPRKFSN